MKHNPRQAENSKKNLTSFQMDIQQSPRGIGERGKWILWISRKSQDGPKACPSMHVQQLFV